MKIALTCSDDFSLWIFRKRLIEQLQALGHEVFFLCNDGPYIPKLQALGAKHIPITCSRFISPWADFKLMAQIWRICRRERFDIVHNFTVKLNIFGTIAEWLARVPMRLTSITGAGYYFDPDHEGMGLVKRAIRILYRIACRLSTRIWFQNPDSIEIYRNAGVVRDESKIILIRSSGVNLAEYDEEGVKPEDVEAIRQEFDIPVGKVVVTKIARPIWHKGIKEYLEITRLLEEQLPNVLFLLVGACEADNPDLVPEEYLFENTGRNFRWLRWRTDIKEILSLSDLVVTCSYMEGVPRSLLEAMAMRKAIIASDVQGCREVVENGINGYLVPAKDASAMAEAILELLLDSAKLAQFAAASRRKVEQEFDEKLIVSQLLSRLYRIVPREKSSSKTKNIALKKSNQP